MDELIDYAKRFIGIPYIYGGNNPLTGMDCSGLMQWIFHAIGFAPHDRCDAQQLYNMYSSQLAKSIATPQKGALVFYGKDMHSIDHIAFAINDNWIIESAGGDHTTLTIADAKIRGACVRERLYNYRKDLVAIILPQYPIK